MTKLPLLAATVAIAVGAIAPSAATAQRYGGGYAASRYDDRYDARVYRGDDRYARDREPRRCGDGTTGAILGAIAGGLLGRTIDTRGDRSIGTLLGAGGGALAGRAIERDGSNTAADRGRCYR